MIARVVVLEISALEAENLSGLVQQFIELLDDSSVDTTDPAVTRLMPDAYRGDQEASAEFRRLTGGDLLERRRQDASVLLASLSVGSETTGTVSRGADAAATALVVTLDQSEAGAWLRTLSAVRLVLASRLGIQSEDDLDDADPRFGVYEWLGMRLEGLLDAVQRAS